MKKSIYVIESEKGYLSDIESYTNDIYKAAVFVDYDSAVRKLCNISGGLSTSCTVTSSLIDFPRHSPL